MDKFSVGSEVVLLDVNDIREKNNRREAKGRDIDVGWNHLFDDMIGQTFTIEEVRHISRDGRPVYRLRFAPYGGRAWWCEECWLEHAVMDASESQLALNDFFSEFG